RRACRRPGQRPPGGAGARRRAVQGALRVPLAGSVQSVAGSDDGTRFSRRDLARRRGQDRAFLLHVRPALLLDEDHAGGARRPGRQGARVPRPGRRDLPPPAVTACALPSAAERLAIADAWLLAREDGPLVVVGASEDAATAALARLAARTGAG